MGARNAWIFLIYAKLSVLDLIIRAGAPTAKAKLKWSISIESEISFDGGSFGGSKCMNLPHLRKTNGFRCYNTNWSAYSERKAHMFDFDRKLLFVQWEPVWRLKVHESSRFT